MDEMNPGAPAPQQQGQQGGGAELNGQQLSLFKQAVQVGQQIIYDKQRFKKILDMAETPQGLAGVAVLVVGQVEQSMQQPMDPMVLMSVGLALIADTADAIGEVTGKQYGSAELQQAVQQAIQLWLSQNGDRYSREEMLAMTGLSDPNAGQPEQPAQPAGPQGGGLISGAMGGAQ